MKVASRPVPGFSISGFSVACWLCALCLLPVFLHAQENTTNTLIEHELTVSEGDTYQSLSMQHFGTVGLWRHIAEYNQLDPTVALAVGQEIKLPSIKARPIEFANVVYAHGDATYLSSRTSSEEPVSNDTRVYLQDIIDTGRSGFVSIAFRTGTVINLQPGTRVQLVSLNCLESDEICFIEISADSGSFESTVESARQKTEFNIITPTATAAVRGTTFDFSASATDTTVGVTNGAVALSAGSQLLELQRGFGMKAEPNQAMGSPIALLPTPTFTSIPPRLAPGDKLGAWDVEGATEYEWSITNDLNGRQVLSRSREDSPQYILGELEAGQYILNCRAIDPNGLKGFISQYKINVAGITKKQPVKLSSSIEDNILTVNVLETEDSVGYEMQLSDNKDFIDAVSIDVGSSGQARFASPTTPMFIRARMLIKPDLISAFGPTIQID